MMDWINRNLENILRFFALLGLSMAGMAILLTLGMIIFLLFQV
jgi:hypothetical protein